MDRARLEDTIIAVSTPPGSGGLGIVRLSGGDSLAIASKLFVPTKKYSLPFPARKAVFGHIVDPDTRRILDEAFLTYFPAPRSYTREDVVEISCHGSPAVLEETVRLGVAAGARPAMPGEFTLRAYLHGRIDILQAEAIQSLIYSSSLEQARLSIEQVRGRLSCRLGSLRDKLVALLSRIEASIEFSEEEIPASGSGIRERLLENRETAVKLAGTYEIGRLFLEGVRVALAGRPNVGKSMLFNALLGRERAIVTPFPGTTRDYISEKIRLGRASFIITDMAGLGSARNPAEEEGVRKGAALADEADALILILDGSLPETHEDLEFVSRFRGRKAILVFNKCDLPGKIDKHKILERLPGIRHLDISALQGTHVDRLKEMMSEIFVPSEKASDEIILHMRQKLLLEEIGRSLTRALERLDAGFSEEYYAEDVREAVRIVGQLTGEIASDEILETIFENFCVGK